MLRISLQRLDGHGSRLVRQSSVGVSLSLVDAAGLYFFCGVVGLGLLTARMLSMSATLVLGYVLNRQITFRDRSGHWSGRQFLRHVSVNACGATLNFAIYSAIIAIKRLGPLTQADLAVCGVAFGAVSAMLLNYALNLRFVYSRQHAAEDD